MKSFFFKVLSFFLVINLMSCSKENLHEESEVLPITASFTVIKEENCEVECEVEFNNTSQNAESYKWDFGDGNISTEKSPKHTYTVAGNYTVNLTAVGKGNREKKALPALITVEEKTCTTIVDFDIIPEQINCKAPCRVIFENKSQNATSYEWDFGDGNIIEATSTERIFTKPGDYNITLTGQGDCTLLRTKSISVGWVTYEKTFGGTRTDGGTDLLEATNGNYILLGFINQSASLIEVNHLGELVWEKNINTPRSRLARTPDNGYIVVGSGPIQSGGNIYDFTMQKVNNVGENLFGPSSFFRSNWDIANSVVANPNGSYIIVGESRNPETDIPNVYLFSINQFGMITQSAKPEWETSFGGDQSDIGHAIAQSLDGGYIIVGETESKGAGEKDVYLIKTDRRGKLEWEKTFGGSRSESGKSIIVAPDGGYIIVGETNSKGSGITDVYLIKTDSNGQLEWENTFGGTSIDGGIDVATTLDGGCIIVGTTKSEGAGSDDVYLIKTNGQGQLEWENTFGGIDTDWGRAVVPTSDGGYLVVGTTRSLGSGDQDIYLIKTDDQGKVR